MFAYTLEADLAKKHAYQLSQIKLQKLIMLQLFKKINKQSNHNTAAMQEGWDVVICVHVGLQSQTRRRTLDINGVRSQELPYRSHSDEATCHHVTPTPELPEATFSAAVIRAQRLKR